MKVAVCLQTCNRPDYTALTVSSFVQHNDLTKFLLLHGDDASQTPENTALAAWGGFETVVENRVRRGMVETRLALFRAAQRRGADWVLLLENDIETLRPFPWPLVLFAAKHPQVYCVRLYGRYKDAAKTDKCLETHKRQGHKPVAWKPFGHAPEASQVGRIHWSAQPAVTRIGELIAHHRTGVEPNGLTVRVKKNVFSHIGVERTIGRVA